MIFVTVGTHEQQFDRLLKAIDELKGCNAIADDVVIQSGYSKYEPKYCKYKKMLPYNEMMEYVRKARIVISHGGPASFLMPLQFEKIPVVVPRKFKFGEHVNDHQVEFVDAVTKRYGNIIPVLDIEDLGNVLEKYDSIVASKKNEFLSNNKEFNRNLSEIMEEKTVPYTFEPAIFKHPEETKGLISIIIPIYNTELYLREALDSVISQTFENWEAILVNDGSTDKCSDICAEYVEKDSRFKYICKEHNEGLLLARKTGLENAKGEFIANLDSDDAYHQQFLEKMFDKIRDGNNDFVYCNFEDLRGKRKCSIIKKCKLGEDKIKNCHNIKKYHNYMWNKLIKRSIYAKVIFPQTFIINAEDMIQFLQIIYHSKYTECISDILYLYRLDSSISSINRLNFASEDKNYIKRVIGTVAVYQTASILFGPDKAEKLFVNFGMYEHISLACYFLINKEAIIHNKIEYTEVFAKKLSKSKYMNLFFRAILTLASKGFTLPLRILNQANLRLKRVNFIYTMYKKIQTILRK